MYTANSTPTLLRTHTYIPSRIHRRVSTSTITFFFPRQIKIWCVSHWATGVCHLRDPSFCSKLTKTIFMEIFITFLYTLVVRCAEEDERQPTFGVDDIESATRKFIRWRPSSTGQKIGSKAAGTGVRYGKLWSMANI